MANWSQSHLLQSLGWATLNSFWQIALLWCIFSIANQLFSIPSYRRYQFCVLCIFIGFSWFIFTFLSYFQTSSVSSLSIFNYTFTHSGSILNRILLAASVSYLLLLIFPSYKLWKNWQFVQRIKTEGLQKANVSNRLFVNRIASLIGIHKKVTVYLSDLVNSPITIGYLKPIILLPVAALNNLSTTQVEAILLHELSHIRRYDYLVNIIISIMGTLLYFNPFLRLFIKIIEEERECCCDEMVLQFGYDKVGYASALLALEKLSAQQHLLALGASGKYYLLNRIEKIVGMEKKKGFKKYQLAGILASMFVIVCFHSILIIKESKLNDASFTKNNLSNPFALFDSQNSTTGEINLGIKNQNKQSSVTNVASHRLAKNPFVLSDESTLFFYNNQDPNIDFLLHAEANEVDNYLTLSEKDNVKSTVAATKKVVSNLQWNEIENNLIADAMNETEKKLAKEEYFQAVEDSVNWKNIEYNLKSRYNQIDWNKVNNNITVALCNIKLDSIQKVYLSILAQLDKSNTDFLTAKPEMTPMPDLSITEISKSREELRKRVETIRTIRNPKKIVRL